MGDKEGEVAVISIPEVVLKSSSGGRSMPVIGTVEGRRYDANTMKVAILQAIEIGYREFDTATSYRSEEPLGEAISEALIMGLFYSRDELFISAKLWPTNAHGHLLLHALKNTLQNLKLVYLDLFLIHWPISAKPESCSFPIQKEDLLPMDFKTVWESMEECQRLGLTKSIGVCNNPSFCQSSQC
ncbi:hypothetical protein LguiA_032786 [Lonicera macranthoides]